MNLRTALGLPLLSVFAACVSGSPPPDTGAKPLSAPATSAAPGSLASGDCGDVKIKSRSDFAACKTKCNDDNRDLGRTCNDPNCLQGIGQATRQCLGKCEEGQKTAQQKHCYQEG
jgi:hypothetical protein